MRSADSERDERLIDESLMETFPASDATSPARPGSLLGMRYAANARSPKPAGMLGSALQMGLALALLGGLTAGMLLMRRRH